MRREYEMTQDDLDTIMDACKPVPYMVIGGVIPRTPQQNANDAWGRLGSKMGFDGQTVQPVSGKGELFFTAVPTDEGSPA